MSVTPEGYEKVSLANLAHGAAIERFDAELTRVLENIADPNTMLKKARVISLKVKIIPSRDRDVGAVSIECASTLAGLETADTTVELYQEGRAQVAYQRTARQGDLFENNVKPIDGGKEKR